MRGLKGEDLSFCKYPYKDEGDVGMRDGPKMWKEKDAVKEETEGRAKWREPREV